MKIDMLDGSTFEMPCKEWGEAFRIKYGENEEQAVEEFRQTVARHWRDRTIPTKFGWDEPWGEGLEDPPAKGEYLDHADLGKVVMYCAIRAPLMGLLLHRMSGGKSKVLAIGEDGKITEYGERKRRLRKWPRGK